MKNNKTIIKIVRRLTAWAWQKEIGTTEGCAILKELSLTDGAMEAKIKTSPGLNEWIGTVFASMVSDSPNYTQMVFETHGKFDGKYEWMTVTIQKEGRPTPQEMRVKFEDWSMMAARHIRNSDKIPPLTWGGQGLDLLAGLRAISEKRYDAEVK